MKTGNFIQAVNEIKNNGGSRETFYIHERWKDRCMTIFGYTDGAAEVFEETHSFASFNSVAEAIATLSAMQQQYNKEVEENQKRIEEMRAANQQPIQYETIYDYYGVRGRYYGD